jgi:uncharacterized membrane protein YqjE
MSEPERGVLGPVRGFARTLISYAETRTRLAANELEEQVTRLYEIALWTLVTLFFLGVAVVLGAVFVLIAFWDEHRLLAAGLLAAGFLACGIAGTLFVRRRMAERPHLFASTLEELARDRERVEKP